MENKKPKCPDCNSQEYIIDWDNNQLICIACGRIFPM